MQPMIQSMVVRKVVFSMVIMIITVSCHCMSFAVISCWCKIDETSEEYHLVKEINPRVDNCVSYETEGGIFQEEGKIPAIICGPGNIKRPHKRNEFIAKEQIAQCSEFIEKLLGAL